MHAAVNREIVDSSSTHPAISKESYWCRLTQKMFQYLGSEEKTTWFDCSEANAKYVVLILFPMHRSFIIQIRQQKNMVSPTGEHGLWIEILPKLRNAFSFAQIVIAEFMLVFMNVQRRILILMTSKKNCCWVLEKGRLEQRRMLCIAAFAER